MKQGFSRNKLKYIVNEQFFDTWSPQMAYILGFTFADGNIYRTSLSWDIQRRDLNILKKINKALESTYKIKLQRRKSYRLRMNNRILIGGAVKMGLLPKKNIRDTLPTVPSELLRHFVRGYLDGDGWIVVRRNRNEIDLGFCSGNKEFLNDLCLTIAKSLNIKLANVRKRLKLTPKKIISTTYMVEYYSANAFKIAQWLYKDLQTNDLFMERKYRTYLQANKLNNYLQSGTKIVRVVQRKIGKPIKEILEDLHLDKKYDGVKIARILKIHSSSVYRWLARTGIKYPIKRTYG